MRYTHSHYTAANGENEELTPEQMDADRHALQEFGTLERAVAAKQDANDAVYAVVVSRVRDHASKLPPLRAAHWAAELRRVGVND